ncbi:serine/threonine protein kinase [Hyalangium rubrum]|uniref:Serine/threonine-protein kinase n=1 Tax=Hyalangium rubrum TaxID=3103134 RepID=A0ABU5H1V0_9BACT|nr:serine/threonine-protein kinase [Hyalangium sp. s54d21]MDY7227433.1 serine/threonine-protein kinase [Hyalangium sp. s54d21]
MSPLQSVAFGNYLLLDRLAEGGMAEVWRAKMFGGGGLERLVALKRILPALADAEEFIAMFVDEAKIGFQLIHPNIVQTYEVGEHDGVHFLSLEYIPGKSLGDLLEQCQREGRPVPLPLACYCIAMLCEGLEYAHRKRDRNGRELHIVHRGLSLQDVLVSYEGEVKVIDFGIAKAAGRRTQTQPGIIKGKLGYLSPEQIRGEPVDGRADVFTVGVCLYELLTGRRPFVGAHEVDTLRQICDAQALPPSTHDPRIPSMLDQIVLKALARDVSARYRTAGEFGEDLQRFLALDPVGFGRESLRQYLQAHFAEEVKREARWRQEVANLPPLKGDARG